MHESIDQDRVCGRLPEWSDTQGLVLSAYPHLDQAAYLLYRIEDADRTKLWLSQQLEFVTRAFKKASFVSRTRGPRNVNIAFTWSGIEKLSGRASQFSDPFVEGIHGREHRSRVLGDADESSPEKWRWGGPRTAVDLLLMVFVRECDVLDDEIREVSPTPEAATLVECLRARRLREMKGREHFGFRDGISQPILEGSADAERFPESIHVTALGEFVLGYPNAAGNTLGCRDARGHIAPLPALRDFSEFGRNGTYLVLRQLAQHVDEFWTCVVERSRAHSKDDPAAQQLAAKIVGRWPDGTPLVPYANADDNEFGFAEDPYGYGCPIGAHVRRANPRDALENNSRPFWPRNDHRILRRGRSYRRPSAGAGDELGLMFLCLNADLERQFEFIQQNWINNPAFAGLSGELDPLVGSRRGRHAQHQMFTIASLPAPHRLQGLPEFVTVKGGQYFFMPGMRALAALAKRP
jgi:Dyp-type peroxidase family